MIYLRPPLCPRFNLFFVATCLSLGLDILDIDELLNAPTEFELDDAVLLDELDTNHSFAVSEAIQS